MIRVLAILPRNLAVVSTEGLHRVTAGSGNKIVAELVDAAAAADLVDAFKAFCPGEQAGSAAYASLEPIEPQGPGYDDMSYEPDVLAILPGCVICSSRGMYRVNIMPADVPEFEFQCREFAESYAEKEKPNYVGWDPDGYYVVQSYDELAEATAEQSHEPLVETAVA